ncbi:MAG: DUF871 family protein [Ileibacterium sp.]|nr:DUF871 family protein [Ileibacterium sp.]
MPAKLGQSWYLSQYAKEGFPSSVSEGGLLFTSAHIQEEKDLYSLLPNLLKEARQKGVRTVVDIDLGTIQDYGCSSLQEFQQKMQADLLRLDDGFSLEEILSISRTIPVALNASTLSSLEKKQILQNAPKTLFIHNFYPRPETGLDWQTFAQLNEGIPAENTAVFICGDIRKRGPLFMGLPTLEEHRSLPPYAAYVQLRKLGLENILLGDPGLSDVQKKMMDDFEDGILTLPVSDLDDQYCSQVFALRPDSPAGLKRLSGTRRYGKIGREIVPSHTCERLSGSITQDNVKYGRYSGEIMMMIHDYDADEKVNVIGHVQPAYLPLLKVIDNSDQIRYVQGEKI